MKGDLVGGGLVNTFVDVYLALVRPVGTDHPTASTPLVLHSMKAILQTGEELTRRATSHMHYRARVQSLQSQARGCRLSCSARVHSFDRDRWGQGAL